MINLDRLSYKYRKGALALDDVTAEIGPGLHLLLGENGSGKTTLLHLIAGLRKAKPGNACMIDGQPTASRLPGVLGETFIVTDNMKYPFRNVNEMVKYHAPFYPRFDAELLKSNLNAFSMTGDEPFDRFSLGNRRKAQLAYAIALRPKVLLLDEPANGLDILSRDVLVKMIATNTTDDQTVILSTHVVFDFQNVVDGVIVLSHGKMLVSCPVWKITERLSFVSDTEPVSGSLYMQPSLGRINAIVPNDGSNETDIDFILLYGALQSNARQQIINILNDEDND